MMASAIGFSITSSFDGGNIEVVSQSGEPIISGRTAKLTVNVNVKPGEKNYVHKMCHFFSMLSTTYSNSHVHIILTDHVYITVMGLYYCYYYPRILY